MVSPKPTDPLTMSVPFPLQRLRQTYHDDDATQKHQLVQQTNDDDPGNMTGVLSERDYICKIALLGRTSKETKCKEICTVAGKIVTAKSDESVELCMEKMMNHGIRHLPIVDETKKVIGMVSIKDLVKVVVQEKEQAIKVLSDFALGKGGHFGSE
jgi:CBS-domain-containing membrane protein